MSGLSPDNPFHVALVANAIKAMPDHPFVQQIVLRKAFQNILATEGATSFAEQAAAYAHVVATLGVEVSDQPTDGQVIPAISSAAEFEQAPSWVAKAAAIAQAAQSIDAEYLRGIAETVIDDLPSGEKGTVVHCLERAAINGFAAAGVGADEFEVAVELLGEISRRPDLEGYGLGDFLFPAATLLALALTGKHRILEQRIDQLCTPDAATDRMAVLSLLPFGLFTTLVAHDPRFPMPDHQGVISALFTTDLAERAVDADPQRLEFARVLSGFSESYRRADSARTEEFDARLALITDGDSAWHAEMLWLLFVACGNWTLMAAKAGGSTGRRSKTRPRPNSRRPKRKKHR